MVLSDAPDDSVRVTRFFRSALVLTLLAVAGIGFTFERIVDLTPHVGSDFFFSTTDPAVEQVHWIEHERRAGWLSAHSSVRSGCESTPTGVSRAQRSWPQK